jgi:hypothetical protein
MPGAGDLNAEQLRAISAKSNGVIEGLGPGIHWEQSYVTADQITCIYRAENEQILREHAERGGFPITRISEVMSGICPETAKR